MIGGARAAVYRGAAVLFGAEDGAARKSALELGLPCIGEPPFGLAQRGWRAEEERRRGGEERSGLKIEI